MNWSINISKDFSQTFHAKHHNYNELRIIQGQKLMNIIELFMTNIVHVHELFPIQPHCLI